MPSGEKVENRLKTLAMVVVFGIFAFYVPLRLANSENHTRLSMLEPFRLLGPVLVAFGVIGYIMSIWRFIAEAEASPMLGDSGKIITTGIYRYTRNPIYIFVWLVIFGESLFFTSLDLLYYLIFWIVIFNLLVRFAEEPYMRAQFGKEYDSYCRKVPRWFPGLPRRRRRNG
jgi:protein-S-isoprenylcysteine O-methyltransferase Ste14